MTASRVELGEVTDLSGQKLSVSVEPEFHEVYLTVGNCTLRFTLDYWDFTKGIQGPGGIGQLENLIETAKEIAA